MTESLPEDYGRNCFNCNELEADCDCEMFEIVFGEEKKRK